jgi:ClpP class serine protease
MQEIILTDSDGSSEHQDPNSEPSRPRIHGTAVQEDAAPADIPPIETAPPTEVKTDTPKPNDAKVAGAAKAAEFIKNLITREKLINSMFAGYGENATEEKKEEANKLIKEYLKQISKKHGCCDTYNILVLYDNGTLLKSDADRIYNAVTNFKEKKPLLLVLYSPGGVAGSAYLIGKLCVDSSNGKFIITVPRMAKSAATLICCAANEIHMGSLSELGPIDPQINELPALGLKYSVEHIAELVKRYPASSQMFADYLNSSLPLINLGYYERVAESAMQYAEKLLSNHQNILTKSAKEIANELVYKYKDHSFVIDKSEAEQIFGSNVVKTKTEEYELGNDLYMALSFIHRIADILNYNFYFTGSMDSDPVLSPKPNRN